MAIYKLSAEPLSLSAAPIPMDSPSSTTSHSASPSPLIHPHPLAAAASFFRHHVSRLGSEFSARVDQGRRFVLSVASPRLSLPTFAAASVGSAAAASASPSPSPSPSQGKHVFDLALSADYVAKTLAGTAVYTVSNSNNEFVLISDPNNSFRSLGILCFRQEDAQTLLAQVKLRQPVLGRGAKVVPITLDQVYMLKVEGISFRFLPDPLQIKNALTLYKAIGETVPLIYFNAGYFCSLRSANISKGFDGVPVFQSDLLVVKKKNKRYCPIYFQKEDIERELLKASKSSRGSGLYQNIMVGSLEDVLKKMEMNDKNSGWDDLIFIPPGKSYTEHINEVAA